MEVLLRHDNPIKYNWLLKIQMAVKQCKVLVSKITEEILVVVEFNNVVKLFLNSKVILIGNQTSSHRIEKELLMNIKKL